MLRYAQPTCAVRPLVPDPPSNGFRRCADARGLQLRTPSAVALEGRHVAFLSRLAASPAQVGTALVSATHGGSLQQCSSPRRIWTLTPPSPRAAAARRWAGQGSAGSASLAFSRGGLHTRDDHRHGTGLLWTSSTSPRDVTASAASIVNRMEHRGRTRSPGPQPGGGTR